MECNHTLYNAHDLKNASPIEQNMLIHHYWQNVRAAADSRLFDFMAHLDLIKKVGLGTAEIWREEELKTVKTIKNSGAKVEINTSHFRFGEEPYPSRRIMKMLAEYDVPVLLSDDAHQKENITAGFFKAQKIAEECGITNFCNPLEKDRKMPFVRFNGGESYS